MLDTDLVAGGRPPCDGYLQLAAVLLTDVNEEALVDLLHDFVRDLAGRVAA